MAYEPIVETTGVQAESEYLGGFGVSSNSDGLVFAPGGPQQFGGKAEIGMPERLRNWLIDIRLLRRVPLCYLVPDSALLPPESIRFFHVDATWVDRVVDGVFSIASSGTVDFAFNCSMLAMVRYALDGDLIDIAKLTAPNTTWEPKNGMTGMLIRSELARRWPDMIVKGYLLPQGSPAQPVGILRAESISKDIYIALFAGEPDKVEIMEPNVGVRYGVEPVNKVVSAPPYQVDVRNPNGTINDPAPPIPIQMHNQTLRTLRIDQLATAPSVGSSPRMVALHLEQLPFVQEFKKTNEPRGSVPLPPNDNMTLKSGRVVKLKGLRKRLTQMQAMQGGA